MSFKLKQSEKRIRISIGFFALASLAVTFVPLLSKLSDQASSVVSKIIGVIFWLGILAGIMFLRSLKKDMLRYARRHKEEGFDKSKLPGILHFFSNEEAKIVEAIFAVGSLLLISDQIFSFLGDIFVMAIFSVCIFCSCLHCIFNGKNYKYYKSLKVGEKHENE